MMNIFYVEEHSENNFPEWYNSIEDSMVQSGSYWTLYEDQNAPAHYSDRQKQKIQAAVRLILRKSISN